MYNILVASNSTQFRNICKLQISCFTPLTVSSKSVQMVSHLVTNILSSSPQSHTHSFISLFTCPYQHNISTIYKDN